jgi:adenine deaminase
MDMLGVLGADGRMVDVVAAGLSSGKLVSGHASGLSPAELEAYLCAGIESDHEVFVRGDVLTRLHAGLVVELRGMLEHLLPEVVSQLAELPELPMHLVLCTDDLFAATLLEDGGVDHLVRRLIQAGLPPVRAIRLGTYHAAYRLGRTDLGLVAAGRRADLVVLDDLEDFAAARVYASGELIADDGRLVVPCVEGPAAVPLRTMHLDPVTPDQFALTLPIGSGPARIRGIKGIISTEWEEVDVEVVDGRVEVPAGYLMQAVVHRHGRILPEAQVALISGWGDDWDGAIATTVSHDTHNLVVFGRDPIAMTAAANAVIASDGGVAVARGGEVLAHLGLPVAGILSDLPAEAVAEKQSQLLEAAFAVGLPQGALTQPLMQVMASTLACLPGPHLTDLGLMDGTTGELITDLALTP